jgi:ethanolamine utilization protein EutN
MELGIVVGNVVSTRKHEDLVGNKLLLVRPLEGKEEKKLVAIDVVGAGIGDAVLIAKGSSARCACFKKDAPVDAAIVGILDECNQLDLNR